MFAVNDIDGLPAAERRFLFLSGRLSLDLVATIGERWRRRFERLRTPGDLDRWLRAAALPVSTPATEQQLSQARVLRAALERLATAALRGEPPPERATATVNEFAAHPDLAPQLAGGAVQRRPGSVEAALATVARDGVELFGGPLAARVRECAADDCALLFVDTSRPGTRRWCSMRGCGNRTKTARYRRARRVTSAVGESGAS